MLDIHVVVLNPRQGLNNITSEAACLHSHAAGHHLLGYHTQVPHTSLRGGLGSEEQLQALLYVTAG